MPTGIFSYIKKTPSIIKVMAAHPEEAKLSIELRQLKMSGLIDGGLAIVPLAILFPTHGLDCTSLKKTKEREAHIAKEKAKFRCAQSHYRSASFTSDQSTLKICVDVFNSQLTSDEEIKAIIDPERNIYYCIAGNGRVYSMHNAFYKMGDSDVLVPVRIYHAKTQEGLDLIRKKFHYTLSSYPERFTHIPIATANTVFAGTRSFYGCRV